MRVVIVIPTYNEKENIELLVPKIFSIIPDVDVIVADDNSPDGTGELVSNLKYKFPRLSLLSRDKKDGLGKAYINAFKNILDKNEFEKVVMMDADFSHDPKYLPEMLEQSKKFDVVIGSRYVSGGETQGWELWRRLLSSFGNSYCRIVTRLPVKDCTGGFNVISTNVLRKIDFDNMDMSGYAFIMEIKYLLYKAGAKFFEVPIIFVNRARGETKISSHIISEGIIAPWKMKLIK